MSMVFFQFPEDKAADFLGLQVEDDGKFGVQELLGILEEILVGLVELPAGCSQRLLVPVQCGDHAHQTGPVAGIDQLPIVELPLVLVGNEGRIAHGIIVQELQQCILSHQRPELCHGRPILHRYIEFGFRLLQGLKYIILGLFLSETHKLHPCDPAGAVDAVEHLLSDLIHKNPS